MLVQYYTYTTDSIFTSSLLSLLIGNTLLYLFFVYNPITFYHIIKSICLSLKSSYKTVPVAWRKSPCVVMLSPHMLAFTNSVWICPLSEDLLLFICLVILFLETFTKPMVVIVISYKFLDCFQCHLYKVFYLTLDLTKLLFKIRFVGLNCTLDLWFLFNYFSVRYEVSIVPTLFVEKSIPPSMNSFCIFVKNQWICEVYFWPLHSSICLSQATLHCFSTVSFKSDVK